jgi:CheY-like chemotaxis protein
MVMKLQRDGLIRLKAEWLQILDGSGLEAVAQWSRPMSWTKGSDHGSERPADGVRRPPAAPSPLERTARRILVVEDDQILALQMQDILSSLGFEVLGPARSLEAGLRLAEASEVDAAVLDVRLDQGQRVFPVARTLQRRSIPFSFMTGYTDPELEGPVLKKPIETGSVAAVIEQLIH